MEKLKMYAIIQKKSKKQIIITIKIVKNNFFFLISCK